MDEERDSLEEAGCMIDEACMSLCTAITDDERFSALERSEMARALAALIEATSRNA